MGVMNGSGAEEGAGRSSQTGCETWTRGWDWYPCGVQRAKGCSAD